MRNWHNAAILAPLLEYILVNILFMFKSLNRRYHVVMWFILGYLFLMVNLVEIR